MTFEELKETLEATGYDSVNEDLLMDDIGITDFIDVKGKIDGEDGAFFFPLEEGAAYIPYYDDVDGHGDYRASGDIERLRLAGPELLSFLKEAQANARSNASKIEAIAKKIAG